VHEGGGPRGPGGPGTRVPTGGAGGSAGGPGATAVRPTGGGEAPPATAARSLFAMLDPTLAARLAPGDVLVAGQQLGGGPGGTAAARALHAAGIVAVIAASYADGFADALLDAGVPALEVDAPAVFHTGQRLRINLEGGTIANLSSGDRQPVRNLTEPLLARLRDLLAT